MKPVNVFPSTGALLHCLGRRRQGDEIYKRSPHLQTILKVAQNAGVATPIAMGACILIVALVGAASVNAADSVAEIQSVLRAQQDAWNRGAIDEFMNGYAKSASTLFVSGDEVRRGWETVRKRYSEKYSDRTMMGKLSFSEIEVNMLSPEAAVVLGRWALKRANDQPHGRFTLVFKFLPEGWRIVHDHTSVARE
ncbi:MAG TPA: nuclear transport factor 2 family protein [Candidatus Udaeobacter sp.]|jgi:uncharacterized protein (TIGR02246 family)|nr:nuclear transport factor 2 family protein [Candidatus Udaeobacter sp.]